jgi:hypothetical protein
MIRDGTMITVPVLQGTGPASPAASRYRVRGAAPPVRGWLTDY